MSYGLKVWDAAGVLMLDSTDQTFRYLGSYTFTPSQMVDVLVSASGADQATHFAVCAAPQSGVAVVEANQIRIYPGFTSYGTTDTVHLFRI